METTTKASEDEAQQNRAQPTDTMIALVCHNSLYMTKRVARDDKGDIQFRNYDEAARFRVQPQQVRNLDDVERLLKRVMRNPHACIIRGELIDPSNANKIIRWS